MISVKIFENFSPQMPENIERGIGPRLPEMNYPNKIQSHPNLAADQPVVGVPVPNYNTQRPQVQNKKTWWRWDFVRPWRKVISPRNWQLLQRQRHGKNQLDAIWEALSRMNTNINVIRSVWRRRIKKDVKIRDLTPLADVKVLPAKRNFP